MAWNLQRHLADFSGVAVASAVATVADGVAFTGLLELGAPPFPAALAGALLGGVLHYSACRFLVFRRFDAPIVRSAFRYVLMSGSAALLHAGVVAGLAVFVSAAAAWLVSKVLVYVAWTYPWSRFAVFAHEGDEGMR